MFVMVTSAGMQFMKLLGYESSTQSQIGKDRAQNPKPKPEPYTLKAKPQTSNVVNPQTPNP